MTTRANTTAIPYLDLNDGNRIPQLGFGVFQVPPEDTANVVTHALRTGYRSIDTAAMYENEAGVGEAIAQSDLDREDLFITTKLANNRHGHDRALRAFEESLQRVGMEYVDLYLIHWPRPSEGKIVETWEAFTELKQDGRARSIGVSNFRAQDIEAIGDATGVTPRSIRSSCTRASSRRSYAASMPSATSSRRRGAPWGRARSWMTRRSRRSRRATIAPPRR
jgi:2,5-diketo-D-gluconate reductase A